jgi:phage shock protein A
LKGLPTCCHLQTALKGDERLIGITLQMVHDAEKQLDVARQEAEETRAQLRELRRQVGVSPSRWNNRTAEHGSAG